MPIRQKVFAIIISITLFLIIIELVRRRKLREEYSWLWLLTGFTIFMLIIRYYLLVKITNFVGVVLPTSTLFFFGLLFLMLISLQYSVKISNLTDKMKIMAQKMAILENLTEENIYKNKNIDEFDEKK